MCGILIIVHSVIYSIFIVYSISINRIFSITVEIGWKKKNQEKFDALCSIGEKERKRLMASVYSSINCLYHMKAVRYSILFHFIQSSSHSFMQIVIEIVNILDRNSNCFKLWHVFDYSKRVWLNVILKSCSSLQKHIGLLSWVNWMIFFVYRVFVG